MNLLAAYAPPGSKPVRSHAYYKFVPLSGIIVNGLKISKFEICNILSCLFRKVYFHKYLKILLTLKSDSSFLDGSDGRSSFWLDDRAISKFPNSSKYSRHKGMFSLKIYALIIRCSFWKLKKTVFDWYFGQFSAWSRTAVCFGVMGIHLAEAIFARNLAKMKGIIPFNSFLWLFQEKNRISIFKKVN